MNLKLRNKLLQKQFQTGRSLFVEKQIGKQDNLFETVSIKEQGSRLS